MIFERMPSNGVVIALAIGSVISTLFTLGYIGWAIFEAIRLTWW